MERETKVHLKGFLIGAVIWILVVFALSILVELIKRYSVIGEVSVNLCAILTAMKCYEYYTEKKFKSLEYTRAYTRITSTPQVKIVLEYEESLNSESEQDQYPKT